MVSEIFSKTKKSAVAEVLKLLREGSIKTGMPHSAESGGREASRTHGKLAPAKISSPPRILKEDHACSVRMDITIYVRTMDYLVALLL